MSQRVPAWSAVSFPTLQTRKALLIIDCQNDFLADDAPLCALYPPNLTNNILELANAFRSKGQVVWVRTEYGTRQVHQDDEIILASASNLTPAQPSASSHRSRVRASSQPEPEAAPIKDPEAFLGFEGDADLLCVRKGTHGAAFPDVIQNAIDSARDREFVKSHYSAFQSGQLATQLRSRLVTEIFICGSLLNISVFATAVAASQYGFNITLIEDCCGFRSQVRQKHATKRVMELTGCAIAPLDEALCQLNPAATGTEQKKARKTFSRVDGDGDGDGDTLWDSAKHQNKKQYAALVDDAKTHQLAIDLTKGIDQLSISDGMKDASIRAQSHTALETQSTQPQLQVSTASAAKPFNLASVSDSEERNRIELQSPNKARCQADNININVESTESMATLGLSQSQGTINQTSDEIAAMKEDVSTINALATTTTANASTSASAQLSISQTPRPEAQQVLQRTQPFDESQVQTKLMQALCEGDTTIINDVLPPELENDAFEKLKEEVEWAKMSHQGGEVPRLVAVQGKVDKDGSQPVYRHPTDESPPLLPFTPTVHAIKKVVEKHLQHDLNHVLIQWYRDSHDYISEHSDKTLDIARNSSIANVSLGAQRIMILRAKKMSKCDNLVDKQYNFDKELSPVGQGPKRQAVRIPLSHNSLFKMGLQTNMRWLHGIRQDKRADREKTAAELAFHGARISLTFRKIVTFMDKTTKRIWGQGATGKTQQEAHDVVNGQTSEAVRMLKAFGVENHTTNFDWEKHYGVGFDVLHIYATSRLFLSPDPTINHRVQIMLAELGIKYARGSVSASTESKKNDQKALLPTGTPIVFVDNDDNRTLVEDEIAILMYLDQVHGSRLGGTNGQIRQPTHGQIAQKLHRFHQAFHLGRWWREVCCLEENKNQRLGKLRQSLSKWDGYLRIEAEDENKADVFVCGDTVCVADFSFWPLLHEIITNDRSSGMSILSTLPRLRGYYVSMRRRKSTIMAVGMITEEEEKTMKEPKKQ